MAVKHRERVFVDTGAFYAAVDADDQHHRNCVKLLRTAVAEQWCLVTSNFVVAETHALILARLGRDIAARWLKAIPAQVKRIKAEDEEQAEQIIFDYADKEFSYCDATSFAMMKREKIRAALSFDRHFLQYGEFLVLLAESL